MAELIYVKDLDYGFSGYRSVKMDGRKRLTFPRAFREDILRTEKIGNISKTSIHYMIEEREMEDGRKIHLARLVPKYQFLGGMAENYLMSMRELVIPDNHIMELDFFTRVHMSRFSKIGRITLSGYPDEYIPEDGKMLMVSAGRELLLSGFI